MSQINLNLKGKCPKASASPSAAPSNRGWNGYMTKQQSLVTYPFHSRLSGGAEHEAFNGVTSAFADIVFYCILYSV